MAITNISAATAIELKPLPQTVTLDMSEVPTSGAWYKTRVQTRVYFIAARIIVSVDNRPYVDGIQFYSDEGVTTILPGSDDIFVDPDFNGELPVTPGSWLYAKITADNTPLAPSGTTAQFVFTSAPVDFAQADDLIINEETYGYPALVFGIDGTFRRSVDLVNGDAADWLDGYYLFERQRDAGSGTVAAMVLYDTGFNVVETITAASDISGNQISGDQDSLFYYSQVVAGAINIYPINTSGIVGTVIHPTGATLQDFCPNIGSTILYYALTSNSAIKRWDLTTNMAMSDFKASVANFRVGNIRVLANGNIAICYVSTVTDPDGYVVVYNAAGTTIGTLNPAFDGVAETYFNNHMCRDTDGAYYWLRLLGPLQLTSILKKIRVTDGVVVASLTQDVFDNGLSPDGGSDQDFGPAPSCPLILSQAEPGPPTLVTPETTTTPIRWVRVSPTIESDGKRIRHVRLELLAQMGVGTPTGAGVDPIIYVRSSDDGGATFGNYRQINIGRTGQYGFTGWLHLLGASYQRVYEFSGSQPVPYVISKVFLDAVELSH